MNSHLDYQYQVQKETNEELTEAQIKATIQAYDLGAKQYAQDWEWNERWSQGGMDKLQARIQRLIEEKSVILVAGCGTGREVSELSKAGMKVVGIDNSKGMLEEATKRVHAPFFKMDIRNMNFLPESFDVVICSAALEHIPKRDVLKVLIDFARILRSNGLAFVSLKINSGFVVSDDALGQKRYYTTFTREKVDDLVQDIPFELLEEHSYPHYDTRKPSWIDLVLRK